MKAEYINIFISAASQVLEEMAQLKVSLGGTSVRNGNAYEKNVIIVIGLTGQVRGTVSVSMDEEYAKGIASKMMCGMPVGDFDDLAQSAVRELVNMTMGRVATLFEKEGKVLDITPPTLMMGQNLKLSNQISPTLVISLDEPNQKGAIDLDIAVADV